MQEENHLICVSWQPDGKGADINQKYVPDTFGFQIRLVDEL